MKTKAHMHTPGPWTLSDSSIVAVFDGGEVQVASMSRTRWEGKLSKEIRSLASKFKSFEDGAAHLIAAAPELLEGLKLFMKFLDSLPEGWLGKTVGDIGCLNEAYIVSGKALRKVEGR